MPSMAAAVARGNRYHSGCIVCAARSSVVTGANVPAPTWSVIQAKRDAGGFERWQGTARRSAVRPSARRRRRAARAIDRLVARLVVDFRRARDVWRQRNGAVPIEIVEERHVAMQAQLEKAVAASDDGGARAARQAQARCRLSADGLRAAGRARDRVRAGARAAARPCRRSAWSPARRDLITRVSLKTTRSPGATSRGRSVNARSASAAPSTCSRRLPVRSGAGTCAISSRGRS